MHGLFPHASVWTCDLSNQFMCDVMKTFFLNYFDFATTILVLCDLDVCSTQNLQPSQYCLANAPDFSFFFQGARSFFYLDVKTGLAFSISFYVRLLLEPFTFWTGLRMPWLLGAHFH